MAAKAKNSKKQQQPVATVMVTPNPFVVPDKIFSKISTAAASPLPDINGNSSSTSPKMGQDQPLAVLSDMVFSDKSLPIPVTKQFINPDDLKDWADQMKMESTVLPPVFSAADSSAWKNRFSGWVASNLVPGATFKIKMAFLCSLFQLLPGCIGLKSVSRDAVKLFCVEFAFQKSLIGGTKMAISDGNFLTTLKIAQSSGVASVSSLSLSVALCNILLGISSDDIKTALNNFGVVTSVKLKPVGLWQYAVVHFKDTFFAATALFHWSVLVKKDSVRILLITNQKEIIFSRDIFKAKLVNLPFGYTAFEISNLVSQVGGHICFILHFPNSYRCQQFAVVIFDSLESLNIAVSKTETLGCHCCYRCQGLDHLALECKMSLSLPPKVPFNFFGGPKVFKSLFAGSKSYAKAAAIMVPPIAAAADINLDLGSSLPTTTLMLSVAFSVINNAVKARLASLESHLGELSLLIKFLVEPVGALVVLVTKLLSTPPAVDVSVKKNVAELAEQNKGLAAIAIVIQKKLTCLKKKCKQACLKDVLDNNNMDNDDNDDNVKDKNFSVYDNTFDVIMHLWEDQPSSIKSSPNLTAKWMSSMIKNSHKLVSIMSKMYKLDMFNTLGSIGSTSM
ncbi:hypothetical protein G9A89_014103 [Geosiphon pyriformis]|nr:hypothetical protein G9A89_014103 [Geosiphon pyriformis]